MMQQPWCYGLDIGGSKMELAMFDAALQPQHKWRVSTPTRDYAAFLAQVVSQVERADALAGHKASLGIALPGVLRADQTVLSSNVPCLNGQQVASDLMALLQRPVAIGNDCRCFALSEAVAGAGRGIHKVLGYVLGTGAGGGFCIDGQLLPGRLSGEYGHMALSAKVLLQHQLPLFQCGCGMTGCAEPYISGTGLARLYQHYSGTNGNSLDWLQAYRQQEPAAIQTFNVYLDALAAHLASLMLVLDPDLIVLGGGLSQVGELLSALPAQISQHLFAGAQLPQLVAAEGGDASGVRGAAILAQRLELHHVS